MEDTPRYSADVDLFHDLEDSVARSAEADAATLRAAGYELSRTPTFHRAVVGADRRALKIEWAHDSAFRFYPVQADEQLGYRLHDADAAVNKVLALAGRVKRPKLEALGRRRMGALRKTNPALLAYLSYMAIRLAHMRVLLRETGSLYLHCDPTASHYTVVLHTNGFGSALWWAK